MQCRRRLLGYRLPHTGMLVGTKVIQAENVVGCRQAQADYVRRHICIADVELVGCKQSHIEYDSRHTCNIGIHYQAVDWHTQERQQNMQQAIGRHKQIISLGTHVTWTQNQQAICSHTYGMLVGACSRLQVGTHNQYMEYVGRHIFNTNIGKVDRHTLNTDIKYFGRQTCSLIYAQNVTYWLTCTGSKRCIRVY